MSCRKTRTFSSNNNECCENQQIFYPENGDKGWTMSTVKERYGLGPDYKILEKVIGYINGTGTPPDLYVDMYASDGGYTLDKDLALDFRGERGQDGSGTIDTAPTVDAGGDKIGQLGVEQTFVATITPGTGSIASILWEQISGTEATLSGQNTNTLKVNGFALGVSTFKVTVTDINNLTAIDTVVLTGTEIPTIIPAPPTEGEVDGDTFTFKKSE